MADVVVIIFLLLFAGVGYRKGLIKSALSFVSSGVSLVLSFIVYPIVNMGLKLTPIYTSIYEGTLKKVQAIDFGSGVQTQGNAILTNINWLPAIMTQQIKSNNNPAMKELLGVQALEEYIATYATNMIISLLAILVTWLIIKVLFTGGLRAMGGVIEHLPVISTFNHAGGFIFGLIKGILILAAIGLLIPVFVDYPFSQALNEQIENSILTKWLYDNNFILLIYNNYLT